ncbi:hypothetical protein N7532_010873 [Penicillium argentinense]|uniref:C2H2-type domain-containing protein n=1 Tax=Penicillium argentinense TaxID=1131581 RepID=A0A9W9JYZ1_9EURO|nr:uncharacterized protein N7532_010873 [Penicillium argentinense]KAJ5086102.1 hypothetical protein N7532_010873 [Penicillium argentinense]
MTSDLYDSDDAMGRSPPPVAVKPKLQADEPLPPFVPKSDDAPDKSEGDKGTPDRSRKPHWPESQTQTRHGDSVLINFLAPDRPDIAAYARENPLTDGLRQDRSSEERKPPAPWEGTRGSTLATTPATATIAAPTPTPTPTASATATARTTIATPAAPPEHSHKEEGPDYSAKDHERSLSPRNKFPTTLPPPVPCAPVDINNNNNTHLHGFKSPPQRPHRPSVSTLTQPDRRLSIDQPQPPPPLSDIKRSPDLRNRISLPSLPSLQALSPPSSCAGTSPDSGNNNNQILPSIHSALSGLSSSDFPPARHNGLSPYSYPPSATSQNDSPHDRQLPRQFFPQQIPPSPFSHFSPVSLKDASNNPSPASQPSFWRPPVPPVTQPPPPSQAAETPHHPPTPYDMSPMTTKSPATSYPTPTEQIAPTPPAGVCERTAFSSTPQANGVATTGSYKCTHPGCTAPPFQTQYLLNSHANVHSQDRPHFCPVDGCPRGVGGKGFKRKNEMMRHGLVHNSPGYVCPFCPDQQHKYPRPDNLQRHVRVHHVDKNKDDPILRQVLAQRPVGSTRGRRRRMNSG